MKDYTVDEGRPSEQMSSDPEEKEVTRSWEKSRTTSRNKYADQVTRYQSGEDKLQKRIKKSSKRAAQQRKYIQPVEDRMSDLEKRLRLIEGNGVRPAPPATPSGKTNQPAGLIMDIK